MNGKPSLEQLSRSGEASISFRTTFRNLESERGSGEISQIDISHQSQHSEVDPVLAERTRVAKNQSKGEQPQALDRHVP